MSVPLTVSKRELMNKVVVTNDFQIICIISLSVYVMRGACFKLADGTIGS